MIAGRNQTPLVSVSGTLLYNHIPCPGVCGGQIALRIADAYLVSAAQPETLRLIGRLMTC